MEDDGGTDAHDGNAEAASALWAARSRQLVVGVAQGVLLVHRHHPDARIHPGSGVLLHRLPDDRPRAPRLVADQPLPAVERDAAMSGPGGCRPSVAAVAEPDR